MQFSEIRPGPIDYVINIGKLCDSKSLKKSTSEPLSGWISWHLIVESDGMAFSVWNKHGL
jgi:hypothetical protein